MRKVAAPFLFFITFILLNGCAQRVNVRALEPAQIDRATITKKIAITDFKDDYVGLAGKIEAKLANQKIDNKTFFTLINRSDIDKVIDEQKLQNSGLVKTSTVVDIGNLLGAQAIISADVGRATSNDSYYYEKRVRCADKECKNLSIYRVGCTKRVVGLSAQIRMVDLAKGDIVYADTMSKSAQYKHCRDDGNAIPSTDMAAQNLANVIADNFVYKLTPHYRYFSVVLLEDPDLDYTDKQEELLDNSLEYIKQKRYGKAEKLLMDLIDSTAQQSYVAFYNLGVVKEVQGDYKKAEEYYNMADNLMVEPVEEISEAYLRIKTTIKNQIKTQEQLSR